MKVATIIFMVAITMALTITLLRNNIRDPKEEKPPSNGLKTSPSNSLTLVENKPMSGKKVSRFLANQQQNPRATNHCHKNNEICYLEVGGHNYNATCCNKKCVDLTTDKDNCGSCKKKCEYTDACCRGECVELAYDKRHCGACNKRCGAGQLCIYGMCDYP